VAHFAVAEAAVVLSDTICLAYYYYNYTNRPLTSLDDDEGEGSAVIIITSKKKWRGNPAQTIKTPKRGRERERVIKAELAHLSVCELASNRNLWTKGERTDLLIGGMALSGERDRKTAISQAIWLARILQTLTHMQTNSISQKGLNGQPNASEREGQSTNAARFGTLSSFPSPGMLQKFPSFYPFKSLRVESKTQRIERLLQLENQLVASQTVAPGANNHHRGECCCGAKTHLANLSWLQQPQNQNISTQINNK